MKTLVLALLLLPAGAAAKPYFRLFNPAHPQVSAGVWTDPSGNSPADYGSSLALITHSTGDGALFESLQADWALLSVGGGYGNGQAFMALGPSANLLPAVKSLGISLIDALAPSKYENLRQLLAPVPGGSPDLNVAFGPQFAVKPIQNGQFIALEKWQGLFRIFVGAAWKF